METSGRISQYRDRLDKTLASPDLTNPDTLKSLINNQLRSTSLNNDEEFSEELLERRTKEVSHLLEMFRSASLTGSNASSERSHPEWKLKQDTEEFRVMYREGPPGTPFHNLLVEGYVDGPIDACLCVSWESTMYKKWWPHYNVPTFKIISSKCVHKIRIGEQISIVRMKVSWPLSAREALVQYFVFEYFQDDLIVVLLNSIEESENIDRRTHGFTKDMVQPEANDVVRIGVVGGLAMQKVTSGRSYFRTIANMDMKLDFVPPSLINFISRQLVGSGFRLYQKAVGSFDSDEEFKKALSDPLFCRIRDALYSSNQQPNVVSKKSDSSKALRTHLLLEGTEEIIEEINVDRTDRDITKTQSDFGEIEEEVSSDHKEEDKNDTTEEVSNNNNKRRVCVSPEVEQALRTLEKVITIVRERAGKTEAIEGCVQLPLKDHVAVEISDRETVATPTEETRNSSSSQGSRNKKSNSLWEVNHNKVAPASPVEILVVIPDLAEADAVAVYSPEKGNQNRPDTDQEIKETTTNESIQNGKNKKKLRRRRAYLWCFHPGSSSSRWLIG